MRYKKAFSLIEILVAISIFLILGAVTTPFAINFYQRYQSINERNLLVSLFREARTMSMAGQGSSHHGVHIASDQYTLFEGPIYAARDQAKDQTFPRSDQMIITGASDILFNYLTGKSSSTSFTLNNGTMTNKIYVNIEGRIDWQ